MEVDVVPHEGGDEVVGVVVERLHPQLHVVVVLRRRHKEVLRLQLVVEEPVGCALVDEERYLAKHKFKFCVDLVPVQTVLKETLCAINFSKSKSP